MVKIASNVLIIFATALWVSALGLYLAGNMLRLDLLQWVALPDALLAIVLTFVIIRRWITTG